MPTILRPSRAVLKFSGPDAQKLLFEVLTGRLVAAPGPAIWWALLSPQGKIQAEGLANYENGAFWLDVDQGVADAFFKRMKMYKLRAKVDIEDLRKTHVVGWRQDGAEGHADMRGLGARVIAETDEAKGWEPPDGAFAAARIELGIAELGPDFPPDTVFPHDIGMDLLDGVDFKKGCYIGQEVVSRMQHRGTARRRPVIVSHIPGGAGAGAPVLIGEREAGTIGAVINGKAVAILRLDRITAPSHATLGGLPVMLSLPRWATYRFGEMAPEV